MPALVVTGSVAMVISLVLAWLLTAVRYLRSPLVTRLFPGSGDLRRGHIDYLMMAGLLWGVAALAAGLGVVLPAWLQGCLVLGSMLNPAGFVVRAVRPAVSSSPTTPFGMLMAMSFVVTTTGYGGAAWLLARAALG
jgi:hypothetical protein